MANSSFNFTITALEQLKADSKTRWYSDARTKGLQICVTPKGAKTFYCRRKINGKVQRTKLGRFPETELENARLTCGQLFQGAHMPSSIAVQTAGGWSFSQGVDFWKETHAEPHLKDQGKFWLGFYDKDLVHLHHRPMATISQDELMKFHAENKHRQASANHMLKFISAVYNHCRKFKKISCDNPAAGIEKYKRPSRKRKIEHNEFAPLIESVMAEPLLWRTLFLCLLYGGQRKTETYEMKIDDVDLESGLWIIPETKSETEHRVLLPEQIVQMLRELINANSGDCEYVFESPKRPGEPIADSRKRWRAVCQRAGIEKALTIHDLRRTQAAIQTALKTADTIVGATLGHSPGSKATAVYTQAAIDDRSKGKAMQQAANAIDALANGEPMPEPESEVAELRAQLKAQGEQINQLLQLVAKLAPNEQ